MQNPWRSARGAVSTSSNETCRSSAVPGSVSKVPITGDITGVMTLTHAVQAQEAAQCGDQGDYLSQQHVVTASMRHQPVVSIPTLSPPGAACARQVLAFLVFG